MFSGLRGSEWIIILLIVLLLFGARKLPDLARSLGSSAKEFRRGIHDESENDTKPETKPETTFDTKPETSPEVKRDAKDERAS